jgi:hypothetical protein
VTLFSQAAQHPPLFHGIQRATTKVVVDGEQKGCLVWELGRIMHQGRHGRMPGLLADLQPLGTTYHLERRQRSVTAQMQRRQHPDLGD